MADPLVVEDAPSVRVQKERLEQAAPEAPPSLYADRVKVYPRKVSGTFRRLKWWALAVLLGIYYLVPWLRWDRGPGAPDQAILIDMPARRAYLLWLEIWPQEIYFLTGLLILGAIGLFFVTSLAGRVWCGYACPQTVWTDLFMWVERQIEGDRNARMRLDKAPMSAAKAGRKGLKHLVWLLIAAATGGAWIMYFNDAPTVTWAILTGEASLLVYFFFGLFTFTTYLLAGWAREQVCTYMCPWPRFQAAMFDEDTLTVTYQAWRGEPRGHLKKSQAWDQRGDCVDCNACVAVCPTGIDIRDGQQLECISCALCIDACNEVMGKVGRPPELITYATEAQQAALERGETPPRWKLLRLRTLFYAMLMVGVGSLLVYGLLTRHSLDISVQHERNPLFVPLANGDIRNAYTLRLLNKSREARVFVLAVEGLPGVELSVVGREAGLSGPIALSAEPDSVATYSLHLRAPRAVVTAESLPLRFVLSDPARGESVTRDNFFRGPGR